MEILFDPAALDWLWTSLFFAGGLFGGSSSSSSQTQVTTTNVGFNETAGPAIYGSGNAISQTDLGAIAEAFRFAGEQGAEAYRFASEQGSLNLELARLQTQAQTSLVGGFGTKLQEFATNATKSEGERTADLAKWALLALAAIVVAPQVVRAVRGAS